MKKEKLFKILCAVITVSLCVFSFAACSAEDKGEEIGSQSGSQATLNAEITGEHTKVQFDMECAGESLGSFVMELYPEYAPISVENFLGLVNEGYYDGLIFHRIAYGGYGPFVAQGGDIDGDGRANPGVKTIKGEFAANGVDNPLSHTRGVVSMARSQDFNSGSTQFFICYNEYYTAALDGNYAAFGKVIEGMEVVDSFLDYDRDGNDKPLEDIVITAAYVIE